MTHEPSPLEASMSIQQLYLSDNQLWYKNISVDRCDRIDKLTHNYGKDIIVNYIEELVNPVTYYFAADELYNKYRKMR